mgnify:CR=1 FL=1
MYIRRYCLGSYFSFVFFFQAEDGIRDLVRSRGLGDVYKRQTQYCYQLFVSVTPLHKLQS